MSASGEPGKVRSIRIDVIAAAHVVEHVQHGPNAMSHRLPIAHANEIGKQHAMLPAGRLTQPPANGTIRWRDEDHKRPPTANAALVRPVELIFLRRGAVTRRQL